MCVCVLYPSISWDIILSQYILGYTEALAGSGVVLLRAKNPEFFQDLEGNSPRSKIKT